MGNGRQLTIKEHAKRELVKLGNLGKSLLIKITVLLFFFLLTKIPIAQEHPIITKIIAGIMASLIITWLIMYIRKFMRLEGDKG